MEKDQRTEVSKYIVPILLILVVIVSCFIFFGHDVPKLEEKNPTFRTEEPYNEPVPEPQPCYAHDEDGRVYEVECKG